jgi:hypothetical protein
VQQQQVPQMPPEDYGKIDVIVEAFEIPHDAPEIKAITEQSTKMRGEPLVAFAKEQARTYFQRTAPPDKAPPEATVGVGVGDAAGAGSNPLEGITDTDVLFEMVQKQREEGTAG